MSPQASAIVNLFELLPEVEKKTVFKLIADRNLMEIELTASRSKMRDRVLQAVRAINNNTPDPKSN